MDCTTQPLTTNQVLEVGLRKPKCFDFEGNTLNDWLKYLAETICELQGTDCSIQDLTVNSNWTVIRQPKVLKKGNLIHLSGEVDAGDVSTVILSLPFSIPEKRVVPLAHGFRGTTYKVYLKIDTDRTLRLFFTGTAPTGASSKLYLDGVSFFFE